MLSNSEIHLLANKIGIINGLSEILEFLNAKCIKDCINLPGIKMKINGLKEAVAELVVFVKEQRTLLAAEGGSDVE